MVGEASDGVLDRLHLERPGLLHGALGVLLFDLDVEIFAEIDLGDLWMGVLDCSLRVRSPPASRHDPAKTEDRLLGPSEKLVDLALPKSMPTLVALALDGDPLACGSPCDEVYSNVSAVETGQRLTLGPVGPAPDPVDLELGLLKRNAHEQMLEPAPLLRLVPAVGPDTVEDKARPRPSREIEAHLCALHGIDPLCNLISGASVDGLDRLSAGVA